jgi:hypothetical protein
MANKYEKIMRYVLGSNYVLEERIRKFKSHEGEEDFRSYYKFKMRVTKTEEEFIRHETKMVAIPTYTKWN